jgi:hypothetical protein
MANPFPFVAGSVLQAAQLNGIGEATIAYTPTLGGITIGNGTVAAYYTRVNKLVYGSVYITLGSTSAITTTVTFSLPVTAATNSAGLLMGNGYYFDNSTSETYLGTSFRSNTTTCTPFASVASGTYLVRSVINATVPVVYGTNDLLVYQFTYEAA